MTTIRLNPVTRVILVVSKVSLYNKIALPVPILTNYSITHCNSVIRVGNSGRGL